MTEKILERFVQIIESRRKTCFNCIHFKLLYPDWWTAGEKNEVTKKQMINLKGRCVLADEKEDITSRFRNPYKLSNMYSLSSEDLEEKRSCKYFDGDFSGGWYDRYKTKENKKVEELV